MLEQVILEMDEDEMDSLKKQKGVKKTKKQKDPTAQSTFNLKLTEEEKKAKEAVVLPYRKHLIQKEQSPAVVEVIQDYEEGEEIEEEFEDEYE